MLVFILIQSLMYNVFKYVDVGMLNGMGFFCIKKPFRCILIYISLINIGMYGKMLQIFIKDDALTRDLLDYSQVVYLIN